MKWLIFTILPALIGCASAHMQRVSDPNTPHAPTNEVKGGVITYSNDGSTSAKHKRRMDAYKKMHEHCGGPYKIVSEGEEKGMGAAVPIGGMAFYDEERIWTINFECEGK